MKQDYFDGGGGGDDSGPSPEAEERFRREEIAERIFRDIETIDDRRVVEKLKEILNAAFEQPGDASLGERLRDAYGKAVNDRYGKSRDEVARDVEYYMLGLSSAALRDPVMVGYTALAAGAYDTIKAYAHERREAGKSGLEYWLRADKSQPTSPPGRGPERAHQGLSMGTRLDGGKPFKVEPWESRGDAGRFETNKITVPGGGKLP